MLKPDRFYNNHQAFIMLPCEQMHIQFPLGMAPKVQLHNLTAVLIGDADYAVVFSFLNLLPGVKSRNTLYITSALEEK